MLSVAVIPARFGSSRFPGKPLADRTGQPLIQHVVERVKLARHVSQVLVATDDQRIYDVVAGFGCPVVMTRADHANGTSRIAEVVSTLDPKNASLIVNVQADEPQIEPGVIDELIEGLESDPEAPMATLASEFSENEDPHDPNIVKLVVSEKEGCCRALYFSRSIIPYDRNRRGIRLLKHPGVYAYRREFLLEYVTLPPTPLEQIEQLEQLRALEHGYPIAVIKTVVRHHGIDTPQQYEAFVQQYLDPSGHENH